MSELKYIFFFIFACGLIDSLQAQTDLDNDDAGTIEFEATDTVDVITNPNQLKPRRAALLSAILPGAGQVYNGNAWKVPIIYGGLVTFFALATRANDQYQFWLVPYLANQDELPLDDKPYIYTQENSLLPAFENVTNRKNTFRRNRDFYYILMIIWYGLNIVEAGVDAHLQVFNVDDNLQVAIDPSSIPNDFNVPAMGLTLAFKFK